jgi:hypothetical protein
LVLQCCIPRRYSRLPFYKIGWCLWVTSRLLEQLTDHLITLSTKILSNSMPHSWKS